MKKTVIILLLLGIAAVCVWLSPLVASTDWSDFETGTNNIRLDGYAGQEGYIAFCDGNGTTLGYLWCDQYLGLLWSTTGNQGLSSGSQLDYGEAMRIFSSYTP